jgi:hypothetical protein
MLTTNFLVPQRKTWATVPTTIQNNKSMHNHNENETQIDSPNNSISTTQSKNKNLSNNENQTTISTTTYQSEINETISELQDKSRQYSRFLDEHNERLNTLAQQVLDLQNIHTWTQRILNIENRQLQINQTNELINQELNKVTNTTLPTITGHQQILETAIETQVTQHYDLNKKNKTPGKRYTKTIYAPKYVTQFSEYRSTNAN